MNENIKQNIQTVSFASNIGIGHFTISLVALVSVN